MRVIGFSRKWPKLQQEEFTTFRFARKDKDWTIGELVQVVYKPRSPEREVLGTAEIIQKEPRCMAWYDSRLVEPKVTNEEAIADGFMDTIADRAAAYMWDWLRNIYGVRRLLDEPMNKLTLRWQEFPKPEGKECK